MFGKKGNGGAVYFGWQKVADVLVWHYKPEPEHSDAPAGAGTISLTLDNVNQFWLDQENKFELRLIEGKTRWRWPEAERISDECFLVSAGPKR